MTLLLVYFGFALGVSFLCSLLEAVLLSVRRPYITLLEQEGRRSAVIWQKLKKRVDHPLAAILSLNTIANTLGAAGVGAQVNKLTGGDGQMLAVASGTLTLLILVFSEIIPKTLGASYWRKLAPTCGYLIRGLILVLYPFVLLLEAISKRLASSGGQLTRDEVAVTAEIAHVAGVLDQREALVIRNLIGLDQIRVDEIMTPRAVVVSFAQDRTVADVLAEHPRLRFSRIPVYGEGPDDIKGIVLRHRILEEHSAGRGDTKLEALAQPVHAVPHQKRVAELLVEFIDRGEQLFVVVDEYGGTEGIVSLEDYIETLLSVEIVDELDPAVDMRELALEQYRLRREELDL